MPAIEAFAAVGRPVQRNVIAGAYVPDPFADRLDNPGPFVADDGGQRVLRRPGHEVPVAVAHADRLYLYEDLTGFRRAKVDGSNVERDSRAVEHGSFDLHDHD